MTLDCARSKIIATMSFHSDSTTGGPQSPGSFQDPLHIAVQPAGKVQSAEQEAHSDPPSEAPSPRRAPSSPTNSEELAALAHDQEEGVATTPLGTLAHNHLAFAPVALAQYHNIAERLADNNVFRLLRSPAPIRVWVYRSLLKETRLWERWNRTSSSEGNMAQTHAQGGPPHEEAYEESIDSSEYDTIQARPYLTRLRLALAPYTVHFRNPGYMRDETLRMLERDVVKKTLEDSRKRLELREELGLSWEFWDDLAAVLKAAIPSLEKRCFAQPDPAAPEYEGLSGPLIASYSPSLLRDLERLNQIVCVARNVLVQGERTQNLAAERLFDKDIFNLVNVCVRVTARGYDGEAGTQDEDKWQGVINAYKKLLITCLQFLNNLIARNEQRKLMLWIELFDSHLDNELPNFADMKYRMDEFAPKDQDAPPEEPLPDHHQPARSLDTFKIPQQPASSPFLLYIGETGNEVKKALMQHGAKAGANEIAAECRRRWQTMGEDEKNVSFPPDLKFNSPDPISEMEHALRRRRRPLPRSNHTVHHLQKGRRPARKERRERPGPRQKYQPAASRSRPHALLDRYEPRWLLARRGRRAAAHTPDRRLAARPQHQAVAPGR